MNMIETSVPVDELLQALDGMLDSVDLEELGDAGQRNWELIQEFINEQMALSAR